MKCPKCGAEGAKRNGAGRGLCLNGKRHTFTIDQALDEVIAEEILTVRQGIAPEHGLTIPMPAGYLMGKVTVQQAGGNVERTWTRMSPDAELQHAAVVAAIDAMRQDIRGLSKPIKLLSKRLLTDSLSAYMIGDAHFGAYAWSAETGGEDFDTSIASRDLRAAIDLLVDGAPASETGYLVDVGDYLHADNRSNMTPASGHMLDVDTRYQRVIRIAMLAMRYCVAKMLQKHGKVKVFITPGNHNPDSAGWMAMVMEAFYENDARVEIETSPSKFFYQRFHNNLIGITHGDKLKLPELPSIMAHDRPEDWGQTEHRMWWTGHIHHTKHQEYRGCTVEAFNTLAAGDAWHAASGYRAKRQMQRIDIDANEGIYNRGIATVGMIRRGQAA